MARTSKLVGAAALAALLATTGCSGGVPGLSLGGISDDDVLSRVENQEFPLCAWIFASANASEEPLRLMAEQLYALDDPILTDQIVIDPYGSEQYSVEGSRTTLECGGTGYATDLRYGDIIDADIDVELVVSSEDLERRSSEAEDYRGAELRTDFNEVIVTLSDRTVLSITGPFDSLEATTDPLARLMVDSWEDGTLKKLMADPPVEMQGD